MRIICAVVLATLVGGCASGPSPVDQCVRRSLGGTDDPRSLLLMPVYMPAAYVVCAAIESGKEQSTRLELQRRVEGGDVEAQTTLGWRLIQSEEWDNARSHFCRAALAKSTSAQVALGILSAGVGGASKLPESRRNLPEAYAWFALLEKAKDPTAEHYKAVVQRQLSSEQIEEARRMADGAVLERCASKAPLSVRGDG